MSALGLGMLGAGLFLMYEGYRGFHSKTTAAPLTRTKQVLQGG